MNNKIEKAEEIFWRHINAGIYAAYTGKVTKNTDMVALFSKMLNGDKFDLTEMYMDMEDVLKIKLNGMPTKLYLPVKKKIFGSYISEYATVENWLSAICECILISDKTRPI